MAKPWWRKRGWSTQGGLLSGVFRAAQRPTGAPGGLAAAWSPVEMVRLQPAPEARAAPPYPPHSRTPTTGKLDSTPMRAAPPPPPRPSGDLLPGAEVVQAEAGK